VLIYSGAKFLCPCAGTISLMPGTGSNPAFRRIDVDTGNRKGQRSVLSRPGLTCVISTPSITSGSDFKIDPIDIAPPISFV
jgi:hypothetical protein